MRSSVLFVLGAGFSAPFDIPTMTLFLQSFEETAKRKYPELFETLQQHLSKIPKDGDLESLLSSLGSAERIRDSLPPNVPITNEQSKWELESHFLKSHLSSYIIERCERFDRDRAVTAITPLLRGLSQSSAIREAHLFTTNYDRIIEHVCESSSLDLSDGFGRPTHEQSAPWTRNFSSTIRLYKLHGSVTYYVDKESGEEPTFLRLDRGYPLPSPDYRLTREGHNLEPLMVLPTLEKDALADPYGHLQNLFVDAMSRPSVVVAIGTSLRDELLVSAMKYRAKNIVVLIVDIDPRSAAGQIASVDSVTLPARAEDFLSVSADRLVGLFEKCVKESDRTTIARHVKEFASREYAEILQRSSMSDEQREALDIVRSDHSETSVLGALHRLHGIADESVINAVIVRSRHPNTDLVRKAAAGCLGLSGNPVAVSGLRAVAIEDQSSDVRLESYLALQRIGTREAEEVLGVARSKWRDDRYFPRLSGEGDK